MATAPTLVRASFLGRTVGGGCTAGFKARLAKVEAALVAEYERDRREGRTTESFADWHNVHSVGGFRRGGGFHGRGEAIDIDYFQNPYIATRSGASYGGEAAGAHLRVRRAAVEVYDRAMGGPGLADVSGRRKGESIGAVYDRFEAVNVALRRYFEPYFNIVKPDGSAWWLIERKPITTTAALATAPLEAFAPLVASGELRVSLADVPLQVLRDYEIARIPTVKGSPDALPKVTRNMARGFQNLRRPVVVGLVEVGGMRWGQAEFGSAESGDGMHFDSGTRYTV